jgi:hypothetical protein
MIEASNIIAEYLDASSPADELLAAGQLGQLTLEHMYPEAGEEIEWIQYFFEELWYTFMETVRQVRYDPNEQIRLLNLIHAWQFEWGGRFCRPHEAIRDVWHREYYSAIFRTH